MLNDVKKLTNATATLLTRYKGAKASPDRLSIINYQ